MPKDQRKQDFCFGSFPEVGQKQWEEKRERERKRERKRAKVSNNNGQYLTPEQKIVLQKTRRKFFWDTLNDNRLEGQ